MQPKTYCPRWSSSNVSSPHENKFPESDNSFFRLWYPQYCRLVSSYLVKVSRKIKLRCCVLSALKHPRVLCSQTLVCLPYDDQSKSSRSSRQADRRSVWIGNCRCNAESRTVPLSYFDLHKFVSASRTGVRSISRTSFVLIQETATTDAHCRYICIVKLENLPKEKKTRWWEYETSRSELSTRVS